MKELRNKTENQSEESLYDQAMRMKPRFASNEEAIESYTKELDALAKKRGTTVSKLLTEAENSGLEDEDYLEARHLWMTLSSLRALTK